MCVYVRAIEKFWGRELPLTTGLRRKSVPSENIIYQWANARYARVRALQFIFRHRVSRRLAITRYLTFRRLPGAARACVRIKLDPSVLNSLRALSATLFTLAHSARRPNCAVRARARARAIKGTGAFPQPASPPVAFSPGEFRAGYNFPSPKKFHFPR